jgi:hypothetical protein
VREICKELIAEGEYENARELYSKSLTPIKNMTKVMKENLSEVDQK